METPIGFLDSQRLRETHAPLSELLATSAPSVMSEDGMLDKVALEALLGVQWTSHLLFERERDFAAQHLWAMPPPVSPSDPFGSIPSSADVGCGRELQAGCHAPQLCVRRVGIVDGVDCGLGLFASAPISSDTFLGEYTGVVQCDPDASARDDYAFGLPGARLPSLAPTPAPCTERHLARACSLRPGRAHLCATLRQRLPAAQPQRHAERGAEVRRARRRHPPRRRHDAGRGHGRAADSRLRVTVLACSRSL
tara:strand:- start:31 stop:786 length:756 start_codon:yes stop_codon:yes gene_type:complete